MINKIEVGKTYNTRGGETVTIVASGVKGMGEATYLGVIHFRPSNSQEFDSVQRYFADGKSSSSLINSRDIVFPPEKVTFYVNLYRNPQGGVGSIIIHRTPESAKEGCTSYKGIVDPGLIGTVPVTIEVPQK